MTVSTASEPEETKKVEERSPGAISELLHLPRGDLGQLAPPMPDLRREEPGEPVYVRFALVIGDVAPLTRDDYRQLGPVLRVGCEVEHQFLHTRMRRAAPALFETSHHVHVIPPPGMATRLLGFARILHSYCNGVKIRRVR